MAHSLVFTTRLGRSLYSNLAVCRLVLQITSVHAQEVHTFFFGHQSGAALLCRKAYIYSYIMNAHKNTEMRRTNRANQFLDRSMVGCPQVSLTPPGNCRAQRPAAGNGRKSMRHTAQQDECY